MPKRTIIPIMAVEAFNRSEPANPHIYSRGLHSPFSPNFGSSGSVTFITNFSTSKAHSHTTLKGNRKNNKMERMNGEIRDREKTMRGLKINETPILQGYQLFHNYIRPHMALDGKTPSEACGITIEGKNKWITLIQNASQKIS